uniref:Trimeric intracellular cation channel type B n=1 Tax=Caligus rogercresseyi TaxID=217165 RepID=C1BNA3_CALRO|nr:Trimeric intracellular cation channel type B [Caligus rogercresseyi]
MDPEIFLDVANQVTRLKMYPLFDLAHSVSCLLAIREELGSEGISYSRKHPLSCWITSMLMIFAGSVLANFLLGEPMLTPLKNNNQVLLATIVWFGIFYLPFDVGYKICRFLPFKIVCAALKEVYRAKKVHDGVYHASKLFPNAYVVMIIIGAIKGNGQAFITVAERLARGIWTPEAQEILRPTFSTKACLAAAVVFVIDRKTDLISAPHALVYLMVVSFFVYFKLSSILLGISDPFIPFENLFSAVFLGGIFDALQERFYGKPKSEDSEVEAPKQD